MLGPNETFMHVRLDIGLNNLQFPNRKPPQVEADRKPGMRRPLGFNTNWDPWRSPNPLAPGRANSFPRESLDFPSRQHEELAQSFVDFQDQTVCHMRLNGETGLPGFMYGDLYPGRHQGSNLKAAVRFLKANSLLIAGRDQPKPFNDTEAGANTGIHLSLVRRLCWTDGTDQIRFQQFTPAQTPIFGAQVVTTFDAAGKLAIVSSSLYPAVEEPPPTPPRVNPAACYQALASQIPKEIGFNGPIMENAFTEPRAWVYPLHRYGQLHLGEKDDHARYVRVLGSAWERRSEMGLWRLNLDAWRERAGAPIQGAYVPVAKVFFEDQYNSLWHAILDVERPDAPVLLHFDLEERAAAYMLFTNAADAKRYFDAVPPGQSFSVTERAALTHDLSFGSGSNFRDADDVRCQGTFVDPVIRPAPAPAPDPTSGDTFRVPTVFHHFQEGGADFSDFLGNAGMCAAVSPTAGPLHQIVVEFDEEESTPVCRTDGRIRFGRRFPNGGLVVNEPGLDAEVALHEFAHAVLHFYFPNLFSVSNNLIFQRTVNSLDESQAFFLPSLMFGEPQWSEYAYAAWSQSRLLSTPACVYDWVNSQKDSFSENHGLGMWLGRLYWQIHTHQEATGSGRTMSYLLFKALGSLAPPTLLTAAKAGVDYPTKLKGALTLIAQAIYTQSDVEEQRTFLRDDVFGRVELVVV